VSRPGGAAALALHVLAGCGGNSPPTPPGTGARAAVEEFYTALVAS
jgi:hypothetical protein